MSNWIGIKKEDIDVDVREEELTFYVNSDDWGNNYAVLKVEDVKAKIQEYEEAKRNKDSRKNKGRES